MLAHTEAGAKGPRGWKNWMGLARALGLDQDLLALGQVAGRRGDDRLGRHPDRPAFPDGAPDVVFGDEVDGRTAGTSGGRNRARGALRSGCWTGRGGDGRGVTAFPRKLVGQALDVDEVERGD